MVLTDRMDRHIDQRATRVPIPDDFQRDDFKRGGLPIKICMFDLPQLPAGTACVYVDLDSIVIGSLDKLAALTADGDLWTIDIFPRRFSAWHRWRHRLTGGRHFVSGNSSAFAYRNAFADNPTAQFRAMMAAGTLPPKMRHDDKFIAWSCQQIIRGLPDRWVANFRLEFLAPTMWLTRLFSIWRKRARAELSVVTFAGKRTKLETLRTLEDGARMVDHHGRVGIWSDQMTSGVKSRIMAEDTAAGETR